MGERSSRTARRGPSGRLLVGVVAVLAALGLTSAEAQRASTATPGLVAAYAFSEGSGTTVADLSGNGNTGTLVNATWTTAGKYGNALSFNGTNARVDVPDSASLHLSNAMTLEAWVDPSAQTGWKDVLYKGNDRYYLEASSSLSGKPAAGGTFGTTNANVFGTAALTTGSWTHIAATYDGSALRFYVNGTLVATQAATGAMSSSTNALSIGGDSLFSKQYFSGTIDEVRVYNIALSAASIQTDMATPIDSGGTDTQPPSAPGTLIATPISSSQINLSWGAATDNVGVTGYLVERCSGSGCTNFAQIGTSTGTTFSDGGLVAGTSYSYRVRATDAANNLGPYSNIATTTTNSGSSGATLEAAYAFSEGTGSTVADLSGNGNTGTLVNATWTTAGKYGNAVSFNGTNARIDIPNSPSLQLTNGMTLEAWVAPTASPTAWKDILYKGNDNYYLEASTTSSARPGGGGTFGGSNANVFGTSALPTTVWTHLALTYDGATLRLYVNGVLAGSQAKTGLITTSTNALSIGGDSIYGQYFKGTIDEVRVYNGPLAAADIQTDMNTPIDTGGSTDTQPPSAPGTLTAKANGSSEIDLSWGAATDNVGVTGYRVDRCQGVGCTNFSHLAQIQPPVLSFNDTGLQAGTSYSYQVRAMDGAGNLGPVSNTASATTGASTLPTLVAAYGFEEGSGTTVADSSGNGNTGTINGATWTTAGEYGNALVFNGANARVDIPNSASLQLTSGMTLEAWVNPAAAAPNWTDIVYKGNDNYYLEASTSQAGVPGAGATIAGAHANVFGTAGIPGGTWTYLAVTYDGTNLRFFVNGVQVASQAQTGALATSTNALSIGGDSIYGQYFNGTIDEVRIYNGALTTAQIQTDMSSGVAVPSPPSNLTATVTSNSEIDLSWGASSDAAGVTGYRVERCSGPGCSNFTQIATPTGTTFSDTGLAASTSYSYRVRAIDGQGHLGGYSAIATGFTGLAVSPRQVALTPGQTQSFAATAPGGGAANVTWSVDGVAGGNSTVGTITTGGIYTAPTAAGSHTVTATQQGGSQTGNSIVYATNYAGMFTYHDDNLRTGDNSGETVLTPANVNQQSFGKLFSRPLDGISYASPLYVENVSMGGGPHNVVYVATEHDTVYAFDADGRSTAPLWKDSFINPGNGVTPIPAADTGECCDIPNEIGITSTPVIDPSTNTMYVVAATKEVVGSTTNYVQRLHALDLSTGAEKFGGPVVITATVPGTGVGSTNGQLPFNALRENQRTGLLLLNGNVYFAFSSHGDNQPYHGWVMGYSASTLQQKLAVCITPNDEGAGIWMSGGGLASDASGSIFFVSGNGEFTPTTTGAYGDAFVKMTQAGAVTDYFAPFNQAALNSANHDLGSGGLMLLPDQPGTHPHLMIEAGKDGAIYLVDRDSLGGYNGSTNTNVQTLTNIFPNGNPEPGNFSAPVYLNGSVFFSPAQDNLQSFKLTNGLLPTSATLRSSVVFQGRGASMAASSNGASTGILWAVQASGTTSPGTLYAYDPGGSTNGILKQLWNSDQAGTRDTLDPGAKFNVPLIANGKVFVVGTTALTAYGLLP